MEEIKKITFEITPEEYRRIERKSIYNNCTIDEYIKNTLLGKKIGDGDVEKRTEIIKARITPTELKYVENKIKGTNYTMSDFIRSAILDKDILVIEGIEELAKQLRAIGKNLNQVTMLSHKGLIKTLNLEFIEKKLDEVWKVVNFLIDKNRK